MLKLYQVKLMNSSKINLAFLVSLALISTGAISLARYENARFSALDNSIEELRKNAAEQKLNFETFQKENQAELLSLKETIKKESDNKKSQDELLTAAVAKVAPSVVSIVISKDVPKMEVTYQNPFGNDPFFKNFRIQIPVLTPKGTERQKIGAGTGFIIRKDGYVLTNKHVANDENAEYTVFLPSGEQKIAALIYKDSANDIALLKILGDNLPPVPLGNEENIKLGQTVIAIGNALGEYDNSISVGIISGMNRTIQASGGGITEELKGMIQTDAAINPGNSGGPLVDLNGQVIGVNVATVVGSSNISFSIPINVVKEVIAKVVKI